MDAEGGICESHTILYYRESKFLDGTTLKFGLAMNVKVRVRWVRDQMSQQM